jgi:hypothetical protein
MARRLRWAAYVTLVGVLIYVERAAGDIAALFAMGMCVLAFFVGFTMGME